MKVRVTPEAEEQVERIDAWWRQNRQSARRLFARLDSAMGRHEAVALGDDVAAVPSFHVGMQPNAKYTYDAEIGASPLWSNEAARIGL